MNEREKNLVKIIGTILIMYLLWSGYGRYQSAVSQRTSEIEKLRGKEKQLKEKYSWERSRMGRSVNISASLPGNLETARSQYQRWLLELVHDKGMDDVQVDFTNSRRMGGVYQSIFASLEQRNYQS